MILTPIAIDSSWIVLPLGILRSLREFFVPITDKRKMPLCDEITAAFQAEIEARASDPNAMLYKYCSVASAEKIFRNGTVLLNSAASFNDPFELTCKIAWPENEAALRQYINKHASEWPGIVDKNSLYHGILAEKRQCSNNAEIQLEKFIKHDAGISCFSEIRDSILMWGHYADKHKGVCIGFSFLPFCVALADNRLENGEMCNPLQVKYRENYPIFEPFRTSIMREVISVKASCWSYEQEWRIFALNSVGKSQEIPKDVFAVVVFGDQSSKKDRTLLTKLVMQRGYTSIKFLQAKASKDKYELEFSPYDWEHS